MGKGRESGRNRGGGSRDAVTCRRAHMVLQQRSADHQDLRTSDAPCGSLPSRTPPSYFPSHPSSRSPVSGRTRAGTAAPWLGRTETPPAEGRRGKNKSTTSRRFLILKKSSAREYTRLYNFPSYGSVMFQPGLRLRSGLIAEFTVTFLRSGQRSECLPHGLQTCLRLLSSLLWFFCICSAGRFDHMRGFCAVKLPTYQIRFATFSWHRCLLQILKKLSAHSSVFLTSFKGFPLFYHSTLHHS